MRNFLLLILVIAICGGGGYYEYSLQQKELLETQAQVVTLKAQVDSLQADAHKADDEKKALAKTVADDKSNAAALTAKLQLTLDTLNEKQKALDLALHPPPPTAPPPPPPDPNELGTITTPDGKTYEKCHLLKVDTQGITINYSGGITKILFALLPLGLQTHFGFDHTSETELTNAQVQADEAARVAGPVATP